MSQRRTIEEFSEALRIDRDDLDTELVQQPQLFHDVSDEWALAISRRDAAKIRRNKEHAKLRIEIKDEVEISGQRATDSLLQALMDKHPRYIKTSLAHNQACEEADRWGALKDAFLQRSYALKDLVALFGQQYFERDSSTAGTRSQRAEAEYEQTRSKLAEERKARKKVKRQKLAD